MYQRINFTEIVSLLNDGSGNFFEAPSTVPSTGATDTAWIDLNGDPLLDLVFVRQGSIRGVPHFAIATGPGTYAPAVEIAGVPESLLAFRRLWIGDWDGDLDEDLLVSNAARFDVLVNEGNGDFDTSTSVPLRFNRVTSIQSADANNDGLLDLIVTEAFASAAKLLTGRGDSSFNSAREVAIFDEARAIIAGDFDEDGVEDLAVFLDSEIFVLTGSNSGDFSPGVSISIPVNLVENGTCQDLDGDDHLDLVYAEVGGGIVVLLGDGQGSFGVPTTLPSASNGRIRVRDLNDDGTPDIIRAGDSLSTFFGDGLGGFSAEMRIDMGAGNDSVDIGDLNGDGIPDIVTGGPNGIRIYLATNPGTFAPAIVLGAALDLSQSVALGDLNRDSILDLAVTLAGVTPEGIAIRLGIGDGTFAALVAYPELNPIEASNLQIEDFNGDGQLDLLYSFGTTVTLRFGTGDGALCAPLNLGLSRFARARVARDMDSDGDIDVVLILDNDFSAPSPNVFILSNLLIP